MQTNISKKQDELGRLLEQAGRGVLPEDIDACRSELLDVNNMGEKLWRQRSRANWIKDRDRNTRFYHCIANKRKRRNTTVEICANNGVVSSNNDDISKAFITFFSDLLTSTYLGDVSPVLNTISCSLPHDEKLLLEEPYLSEDVNAALDTMFLEKRPGLDGMTVSFIRSICLFFGMMFAWWFLIF